MTELRLGNVRVTPEFLAEMDRQVSVVKIPRSEIRAVSLEFGFRAERPVVQVACGAAIACCGIVGAPWAVFALLEHGVWAVEISFVVLAAAFTGSALVGAALRRGSYLRVETAQTTRKLFFGAEPTSLDVARFESDAAERFGLRIGRQ